MKFETIAQWCFTSQHIDIMLQLMQWQYTRPTSNLVTTYAVAYMNCWIATYIDLGLERRRRRVLLSSESSVLNLVIAPLGLKLSEGGEESNSRWICFHWQTQCWPDAMTRLHFKCSVDYFAASGQDNNSCNSSAGSHPWEPTGNTPDYQGE